MQNKFKRQVVLDTETTGLNITNNIMTTHRIIEIGAVEIINRKITKNCFHTYINPNRLIDINAFKIHKISNNFLLNKPTFNEILENFIKFIRYSELIIHNALFDIKFINNELYLSKYPIEKIQNICKVTDTLHIARKLYPGKKNTLDNLCQRLYVNKDSRKSHSAIVDAILLAKVYLRMTRIQKKINFDEINTINNDFFLKQSAKKLNTILLYANPRELNIHKKYLDLIYQKNKKCMWKN